MSVVTRWRRTFSSSVTHFTLTSGFLAVKSLVNACMRIMSGLFTVAMVRVVCAIEGAEPNRVAAPSRAPRTCFTVTSLYCVEHMPTHCNYVHTMNQPCQGQDGAVASGCRGKGQKERQVDRRRLGVVRGAKALKIQPDSLTASGW